MRRSPEEEAGRWLRQAEDDLKWARHLLKEGAYHLTCFLSQQGAEKALKAFLFFCGEEQVRGHSVLELCKRVVVHAPDLSARCQEWKALDLYYIPTRYPNGIPAGIPAEAFPPGKAKEALELAEEALVTLRRLMED